MPYSSFDALNAIRKEKTIKDDVDENKNQFGYQEVLEKIRIIIADNHSTELGATIGSEDGEKTLRNLIEKYIALSKFQVKGETDKTLAERIYQDMAGLSILTQYLKDPTVEEININAYNRLEVVYGNRTIYPKAVFTNPTDARNVVIKMVRMGGRLLDGHEPMVDSHIGGGTRVSAMIPPLVPEEVGVVASIRKQNKATISKQELIDGGCATEEMLDFLTMCLCKGVSIGIAGSTGAGKTTDQAFLLNSYIAKNDNINSRVYVIEDTRELCLLEDVPGKDMKARVNFTLTKPEPNPVTMRDLIKLALRFHPQIIVPSEVRDGAALEAAIAGITGHVILTSLHANSAKDAYMRLLSMASMSETSMSERVIMRYVVNAWPIMIFKKRLPDGSRKYMEIFEATGIDSNGDVEGHMLYHYITDEIIQNDAGIITKVKGHYECVSAPTKKLQKIFMENGVTKKQIDALFRNAVNNTQQKEVS